MDNAGPRSLLAIPIIILVAAGVALAGSQGGMEVSGFSVFALGVVIAFTIQWLVFIHAYTQKTEKFFDLTGGLTFITVTLTAVFLSSPVDGRTMLLAAMIIVWAIRLGSFLFFRIRTAGEDRRFREIKISFGKFLLTWTIQGLWVTFTLAAALAAITSSVRIDLNGFALTEFLVWLLGIGIEVVADQQKSRFKANPANDDKFINTGLWAWSRHPNYFGEIVLWIGIAIVTLPVLQGWQCLMLISPLFIILQLTNSAVYQCSKRGRTKNGEDNTTTKPTKLAHQNWSPDRRKRRMCSKNHDIKYPENCRCNCKHPNRRSFPILTTKPAGFYWLDRQRRTGTSPTLIVSPPEFSWITMSLIRKCGAEGQGTIFSLNNPVVYAMMMDFKSVA